ncbi:MAG: hypothetical protein ACE5I5_08765 [Candidatus Heimdallarchaeota archaeon]
MEKLYRFKVALKYRKGLWRVIEVKGSQTLADLDYAIREAFNHDTWDHLSEFFPGRAWRTRGFGPIQPDRGGSGAKKKINSLRLSDGARMEYVYDFGDDIQHVLTLEKITEPKEGVEYPQIVAKSRTRRRYCVECKKKNKKTVATWVCIECTEDSGKQVLLCDDCVDKGHEDHYSEEILY